jgi:holo-[acyl-carrier protein] synthase
VGGKKDHLKKEGIKGEGLPELERTQEIDYNPDNRFIYVNRSSMHCIGVDIVEIARLEKAIARRGEGFLRRVYTDSELRLYRKNTSSLAARFAAKEAVIKALGNPTKDVSLREIEILTDPGGRPVVNLYGKAQSQAQGLGLDKLAVSLSHSKEYAVAFVSGDTR